MRKIYTFFLLAATLAACTTEFLPEQVAGPEPQSFTIVVNATKTDDDASKALSFDGKKLNATWAAGEKVSVHSLTGEGSAEMESVFPVGTLTAQSSGTTTTLKGSFSNYTPTVGAKLRLKFLSDNYINQEGTLEYIAANCDYAFADVSITEVTGDEATTTAARFKNQSAIVKLSLMNQDGTAPVSATSLTVKVGLNSYDVTPLSPASVIYIAIYPASNQSVTLTATSADGTFSYEKTGVTFEKGKYYGIGVRMTRQATLGDLYYSDGTFSATLEEGKTPIGVIAYIGADAFSENGVTLRDGTTTLQSHGLVLCLKEISNVLWRKDQLDGGPSNVNDFLSEALVNDTGDLKRTTYVSGYANTKSLAEKTDAENNYPAAYHAWNYSIFSTPATTTGWFMPSIQQWVKILTALGGMSASDVVWQDWRDTSLESIHNLEAAMAKAGDKSTAYDGMSDNNRIYWSSSESTAGYATSIFVYPTISNNQQGLIITASSKSHYQNVRPVLAF